MPVERNNTIAVINGYIAKEAAKGFFNTRLFSGLVKKDYSEEFEDGGAKKGDQIFVKNPPQFRVRTGKDMKIQNVKETKIPVTLPDQQGVDFEFNMREVTLDLEQGVRYCSEKALRPAGSALASNKDAEGMMIASTQAGHSVIVGTAKASNPYADFLKAKALLNKALAPKGEKRYSIVSSDIEVALAQQVSTLFNAAKDITKAIKTAGMKDVGVGGLTWGASDLNYVHTNGAGGSSVTLGTITPDYVNEKQWIEATADGLAVGDTIEFDCFLVNYETKKLYSDKLQRKVLEIGTGVNAGKVLVYSIRPTLTDDEVEDESKTEAERKELRSQQAMANCSALPTSGTVLGVKGKHYACCPVFYGDAIVLTSVDLARPKKTEACEVVHYDSMVMRYVRDYSIDSDVLPNRLDLLAIFTVIRPEWVVSVEIQID